MTRSRLPVMLVACALLLTAHVFSQSLDSAIERFRRNLNRDLVAQPWSPAQRDLITWAYAVREWLQESPGDVRAQLAHGAMLECLASPAHGDGFLPDMLSRDDQESCGPRVPQPRSGVMIVAYSSGMSAGGCLGAARSAYDKVLSKDSANAEARLRLAALSARSFDPESQSGKGADDDLQKVVGLTTDRRVGYLAQLFRGLIAEKRKDLSSARARYEDARAISADWQSARQALGSVLLQAGSTQAAREMLSTDARPDTSDPWYGYACRILTPDVESELSKWKARQATR